MASKQAAALEWADRDGRKFRLGGGGRTVLMGIVNLTPDSFFDGGRCPTTIAAIDLACRLAEAGAGIIDLGGESSRPGAAEVSADEELKRVIPVVEGLAGKLAVPISLDTWKAAVARRGLEAGAAIINDISALRFDPDLAEVVAASSGPYVMMHMLGTPATMQVRPVYRDILGELGKFFRQRVKFAAAAGIDPSRIIIDPGIGFGKTLDHNLAIINGLGALKELGRPILIGPSRKSFIGRILGRGAGERLWGTAAAVAAAVIRGADIVRVHDVAEMKDVTAVIDRIRSADPGSAVTEGDNRPPPG